MRTINTILSESVCFLEKAKILSAKRCAQEIIAKIYGCARLDLFFKKDEILSIEKEKQINEAVRKRSKKEPLEYILGETYFYGCKLKITKDVLIPRQETEILVDLIVKKIEKMPLENKVLWDIATGSGCIGIALKKRFPKLKVVLSDISKEATILSYENAKKNGVDVEIRCGDLFEPFLNEKADFIISNPPYVSEEEYISLDKSVKNFEPKLALVSGKTGFEFYQRFAKEIKHHLQIGANIFFEIGCLQGKNVQKFFYEKIGEKGKILFDYAKKERFFFLEIE